MNRSTGIPNRVPFINSSIDVNVTRLVDGVVEGVEDGVVEEEEVEHRIVTRR